MPDPAHELAELTRLRPIETLTVADLPVLLWHWSDATPFRVLRDRTEAIGIEATHWTPLPRVRVEE